MNNNNLPSTHRKKCLPGSFVIQVRGRETPMLFKIKESHFEKAALHPGGLPVNHVPTIYLVTILCRWGLGHSCIWLGPITSTICQGTGRSHTHSCVCWVIGIQKLASAIDPKVANELASAPLDHSLGVYGGKPTRLSHIADSEKALWLASSLSPVCEQPCWHRHQGRDTTSLLWRSWIGPMIRSTPLIANLLFQEPSRG